MATTFAFKDVLDLPEWSPLASAPNASAAGVCVAGDQRNTEDRHYAVFQLASSTVLNQYHTKSDGWSLVGTPALAGTFGAGAAIVVAPTRGPRGTIAAGASASRLTLTTALPASVGINQLAGRGYGVGFKIRIIGNSAGGSGLVQERRIVANSGGANPTLVLDSPLSFTPALGDGYEFLSGRVYMLGAGTMGLGTWRYYDILTGAFANGGNSNLPATINTDSAIVCLDEQYVPCDNVNGEGFIVGAGDGGVAGRALTATASAAGTLTGQVASGDAGVLANEWRNFQIRIVKDTATPTAVGQRRRITSHTAGASPVYTVNGVWSVTPSATCQYVIENNNEINLWTSGVTTTYTYAPDTMGSAQTGDTWVTTTYGVKGGVVAAGAMAFQPYGVALSVSALDVDKNFRYSHIHVFRGNSAALDVLDIAGGTNGTWSNTVVYGTLATTFATGSCGVYDGVSSIGLGKFAYINLNGGVNFYRYNLFTRQVNEWAQLRYAQGAAVLGARMFLETFIDGTVRLTFSAILRSTGAEVFRVLAQK